MADSDETTPEPDWDSVHRANYESRAFWDVHWTKAAAHLLASARLLEPEVVRMWESLRAHTKDSTVKFLPDYYQGPYFMLMAYAVENLFKAAIIRRDSMEFRDAFRRSGHFPPSLKGHNLVWLATEAGLAINLEEEDFLRRLTRSAVWYGRYPVPLKYGAISGSEKFSDGKDYSVSWFGGKDIERLNGFVQRIQADLGLRD